MENIVYQRMFENEDDHWWFRGVRLYLEEVLWERLRGMPLLLDAGCGTGGNLEWLRGLGFRAMGFDLSPVAMAFCRKRGIADVLAADIARLPYADGSFDGILCCNVLENREVRVDAALAEMSRVLRAGGFALLNLASSGISFTDHDRAVHCVRRYSRRDIRRAFNAAGFRVQSVRALFGTLYPFFFLYRGLRKVFPRRLAEGTVHTDISPLPGFLNGMLYAWVRMDAFLARLLPLPAGSTYLVLLVKG